MSPQELSDWREKYKNQARELKDTINKLKVTTEQYNEINDAWVWVVGRELNVTAEQYSGISVMPEHEWLEREQSLMARLVGSKADYVSVTISLSLSLFLSFFLLSFAVCTCAQACVCVWMCWREVEIGVYVCENLVCVSVCEREWEREREGEVSRELCTFFCDLSTHMCELHTIVS